MNTSQDALWEALPAQRKLPLFHARKAFLLAHLQPQMTVLDLGCGSGEFSSYAYDFGAQVTAVDCAREPLRRAVLRDQRLDLRYWQLTRPLPLPCGKTQLVWASEVVAHVGDLSHWLRQIRRVLVTDGTLLLTSMVDISQLVLPAKYRSLQPPRVFTPRVLQQFLLQEGFALHSVKRVVSLREKLILFLCVVNKH